MAVADAGVQVVAMETDVRFAKPIALACDIVLLPGEKHYPDFSRGT